MNSIALKEHDSLQMPHEVQAEWLNSILFIALWGNVLSDLGS